MPMVEGFNSYGSRLVIRLAWSVRYFGEFPSNVVIAAMSPSQVKPQEREVVIERVRQVAEREAWWSA